ncbi:hypothetical protein [Polyangium aurulentum]|uniref:hypothetical protein n=1 Tax=Polyangium aurulentum TaxID=2567896 RepID=UPI00200F49C7|nr:hypothetical protein [Polyangium aurulentum]UQA55835.1 hypothetical protein E8A73_031470 [Polyangium aurulentum]
MKWMNRALCVLAAGSLCACVEGAGDDDQMWLDMVDEGDHRAPDALAPNALVPNALSPSTISPSAINPNAINPNAINPNAINPNAINPNALSPSALSTATMSASLLATIKDPGPSGDLSRQLVRYLVGCAFTPSQSLSFTWTDASGVPHPEVYWGLLSLAPAWASGPLDDDGQRWVTACIASRTNWYGTPVNISARGDHPALEPLDADEKVGYPREEGAFWGNMFAPTPWLKACHYDPNIAHSRDLLRDCAAGHVDADGTIQECGIIDIVGSCDTACDSLDLSGLLHPKCFEDPHASTKVKTDKVITIFLPL